MAAWKPWMSIRITTKLQNHGRRQRFELERSSVFGAVLPYGDEEHRDFADITSRPGVYVLENASTPRGKSKIYRFVSRTRRQDGWPPAAKGMAARHILGRQASGDGPGPFLQG